MTALGGLLVPLVTPFARDGSVDLGAFERLAHEVLDDGADGLVALATTAEASSLDEPSLRTKVHSRTIDWPVGGSCTNNSSGVTFSVVASSSTSSVGWNAMGCRTPMTSSARLAPSERSRMLRA